MDDSEAEGESFVDSDGAHPCNIENFAYFVTGCHYLPDGDGTTYSTGPCDGWVPHWNKPACIDVSSVE